MKLTINRYYIGLITFFNSAVLFATEKSDANDSTVSNIGESIQDSADVLNQISAYGDLISKSLYFIVFGMIVIYMLHKLTSKFLYPHMKNTRIIKVVFGTLYALIVVVSILLVLKKLGFDVRVISKVSILGVLVGALVVFFILPFLPRLPFKIGHMVRINGTLGTVDNISTYHTTIRKFDGTMVFIPNTTVMSSQIMNYHDFPDRRIEMNLGISTDSDIGIAKEQFLKIMQDDQRVLKDPKPSLFITNADADGINISMYCWVENGDWLSTRSDLWEQMQLLFTNEKISMSRVQQEIYIKNKG